MKKELITKEFKKWVKDLSVKYKKSQIKAAMKVNSEMLSFYYELGKEISLTSYKATYGSKFYENLSKELIDNIPDVTGLSPRNLRYIESFYYLYKDKIEIVPQLVAKLFSIPWGHHRNIIDKCKDVNKALFYIEPRWQIFINQENKDEIIKVINLGKGMNVKEIFVHEGSCDGNNKNLYNIRINNEIPNEVVPYYLDYNERLTEKECTEILKKDETHFVPSFENDDIVINITSDFNAYFNYTNPSHKWLIGNILKDPFEGIVKKILNNDVEAINIAKKITLKELALKYGDINSNKVFSLDDYKMYLLNEHLSKLK